MEIDVMKIYRKVKYEGVKFILEEVSEKPNFPIVTKECPVCGKIMIKKPLEATYFMKDDGLIVGKRITSEFSPHKGAFVLTDDVENWLWACTECTNCETIKIPYPHDLEELELK